MRMYLIFALLALTTKCEECSTIEMVQNGNFEQPKISSAWSILGSIPGGKLGGWKSIPPSNGFLLWQQGQPSPSAPVNDSLGLPTGQHLQINGHSTWAQISYSFNAPCLLASHNATLSFDYWYRPGYNVQDFEFGIKQDGLHSVSTAIEPTNTWKHQTKRVQIEGCKPTTLIFTSTTSALQGGVNIDNVSFKIQECFAVEMVHNGDFNKPLISSAWQWVSVLPGGNWAPTPGTDGFILWQQGAMAIPSKDSQGNPTGQTLEINGQTNLAQISYSFFVPFLLGKANATLSFQYWIHPALTVYYFGVKVQQMNSIVIQKSLNQKVKDWTLIQQQFYLSASEEATVYFTCDTDSIGGLHINTVSIAISETTIDFQSAEEDVAKAV